MNAANSGMIIAGLSLSLGAAAIGPAWSADASHPYSNVNRSVDAGNDTGNGQTDQLNQRELQRVSPNGGRGGYDRQSNRGHHNDGYRDDRDNRYRYGGYERPPYGRPAGYGYGYGYSYYAPPAYGYGAPYPYYAPYPAFRPWWRPYGWYRPFYRPYHYRW